MRLTLRTLLAWLDDKLQPDQVSEIGKQVADSPMAQELVERIHRVTRQRRLTVPSQSGPRATDPNLVAGYLDNDLDPEAVAAYEKKCLSSDVDLAEAASAHQILSNLGQKVPVPPEAKARMYLLVKGREAHRARPSDGAVEKPKVDDAELAPWAVASPPRRRALERVGPVVAFVALFGVLCWSAYESMKPSSPLAAPTATVPGEGAAALEGEAAAAGVNAAPAPELGNGFGQPGANQANAEPFPINPINREGAEAAPAPADTDAEAGGADAAARAAATADAEPVPDIPEGAVGVVAHVDGLLLRYNAEKREWERLAAGSAVNGLDRLLVLPPFRARVATDKAVFDLAPDTEIQVTQRTKEEEPTLNLAHGRILVEPSPSETPIHVTFGGRALDVTPPAGAPIGLELAGAWNYGATAADNVPSLAVHAIRGETALRMGATRETLTGPGAILASAGGSFERPAESAPPEWLAHPQPPSPEEAAQIDDYLQQLPDDRPILTDIVSATDDDDPEIKTLAINGLRALGDLSFLTPILDRPGDPDARQAAMAALRNHLSSSGSTTSRDWEQLQLDLGATDRAWLESLLLGFSDEDAAKAETYEELVETLSPLNESIGLRELAFDNLKRLSGRTTIPYDADDPEPGFAAWSKLLDNGELRAAPK